MKKIIGLFVLASFFLTVGCGGPSTPEAAAEKFAKAMAKHDWDAAKKVSTEQTHVMIDAMKQFAGSGKGEDITCENMQCEVDGDKAKCTYETDGKKETLTLVKQDGKWLVDEKKEGGF